jgi:hypothetical protein
MDGPGVEPPGLRRAACHGERKCGQRKSSVSTACTIGIFPPLFLSRVHAQPQTVVVSWHVLEGFITCAARGCTRPIGPDSPNARRQDEPEDKSDEPEDKCTSRQEHKQDDDRRDELHAQTCCMFSSPQSDSTGGALRKRTTPNMHWDRTSRTAYTHTATSVYTNMSRQFLHRAKVNERYIGVHKHVP